MEEQYYYFPTTGQTYSAYQMQALFGINVGVAALSTLNTLGFYPVQPSSPDFDTLLYTPSSSWSIVPITGGQGAILVWTPVAKPLPTAITNGSTELKQAANGELDQLLCDCGINNDVVTAAASQDVLVRPARYQAVLDDMTAITDNLNTNLTAVESATTVDEINDIVNPPTGILFTGRGSGLGPEDLNVSYYTSYNSISLPESDTELYVPGTSTVIAYGSGGPGQFDSAGNCFNPGDYTLQIRNSKTGFVIAEFECPLAPAGVDVAF